MSNLSQFIAANWLLCAAFIIMLIIYFVYEFRLASAGRFNLQAQDAINLANRNKGVFLDIRDDEAYSKAHIVGAIHATIDTLKSNTKMLNKHKEAPIIIYCDNGVTAKSAYQLLKKEGFSKVYVLKGGLKSWRAEKLPVDAKKIAQTTTNTLPNKKKKKKQ